MLFKTLPLLLCLFLASCMQPKLYPPPETATGFMGTWGVYNFSMYEFYKFEEDGSFWEHSVFSKDKELSLASLKKTNSQWHYGQTENQLLVTAGTGFIDGQNGLLGKREMIFTLNPDDTLSYTDNKGGFCTNIPRVTAN